MGLGYRAVLHLGAGDDAVEILDEQFRSWLKTKVRRGKRGTLTDADWAGVGEFRVGPASTLTVVEAPDERDHSRRQLLRLREENDDGVFTVSAIAISIAGRHPSSSIIVELDVAGLRGTDAISAARPPRLVAMLLSRLDIVDGITPVYAEPLVVNAHNAAEVVESVLDPRRAISVVVAADPGGVSISSWKQVVSDLTRDSLGVSTTYIVPASLLNEVNRELPDPLHVAVGQIRTFAPQVDVEDPSDALRHRVLKPQGLVQSIRRGRVGGRLPIIHAQRARRRLIQAELPADVRRSVDILRRAESTTVRGAAVARAPLPEIPAVVETTRPGDRTLAGLRSLFGRWLGSDEVNEQTVAEFDRWVSSAQISREIAERQVDDAIVEQGRLGSEMEALQAQVEEAELAARLESDEARKARYEANVLRLRLRDAGLFADAEVPPEDSDWDPPGSIEDLVLTLAEDSGHVASQRVVFTGDLDIASEVDRRDTFGRVAATLWEYVRVLYEFVGLRRSGYAGTVAQYLVDDTVETRKCSAARHARGETAAVMNNKKMAAERVFPVPAAVDPSGRVTMEAHFKPTNHDTYAPRMYYFDDTAGTGKVYIGYIGPHLTNTQTSNS